MYNNAAVKVPCPNPNTKSNHFPSSKINAPPLNPTPIATITIVNE